MNEIGGYFQFEQLLNNEYYPHAIKLNSARNALYYLTLSRQIKKLFIPTFLGDSIPTFLQSQGIPFSYYYVNDQLQPPLTLKPLENEYVLVVNYYGQLTNARIQQLKVQYERIIVDNTQAFFQQPIKQVDTIYSCRKYFGLPDGAYLMTDHPLHVDLNENDIKNSMLHLMGRQMDTAATHYADYLRAEEELTTQPLRAMSYVSQQLLRALPYSEIIESRNENYLYLQEELSQINQLQFITPFAPFCYPLLIKNGEMLRTRLQQEKIYIPTYWPTIEQLQQASFQDKQYARHLLPLPCDQRYSVQQLQIVVEKIKEWLHETTSLLKKV